MINTNSLPEKIKKRFISINDEVNSIMENVKLVNKTNLQNVQLVYKDSSLSDILTTEERSQQTSFVTRFKELPSMVSARIVQDDGNYYFENLDEMRHLLNEYRSILSNQKDSIYYKKLHNFCYQKVSNLDHMSGLSIRAVDKNENDVSDKLLAVITEHTKSIDAILKGAELDYLYNGVLQHAEIRFYDRYWDDYRSGELNYIIFKNAILIGQTKQFLEVYYKIISQLTFPRLGGL